MVEHVRGRTSAGVQLVTPAISANDVRAATFYVFIVFFHEPLGVLIPNLSKNQPPRIGTFISVTAITLQCTVYVRFLSEQLASYA